VTNYVTRVELRNATAVQYVQLHAEMAKAGFNRTIPGPNGNLYHLPTAEYFMSSDTLKIEDVRELARGVAAGVSAGPLVLVTAGQSTWSLVPVDPQKL
jgi:hypothetical protein